uniref:F-box domain-containing protein n=2 Tax=Aegilops tauschii subsp. strangulata TaxID=200361 RepID=A0A453GGM2_AEGTS
AKLPGDVLVDIISRVPYKSTRCCKCVSTRWRDLIAHPDHREKLPRSTLAGFFYRTFDMDRCQYDSHGYRSLSGNWCPIDASLSFLPNYKKIDLLDCCKGLLLCRCSKPYPETPDYVVGNPATEKWVTVPAKEWSSDSYARLGFDPAVSSHFHVFELVPAAALNANLKFDYNIKELSWRETVVSFLLLLYMMLVVVMMFMFHEDNCMSHIMVLLKHQSGSLKILAVKIIGP